MMFSSQMWMIFGIICLCCMMGRRRCGCGCGCSCRSYEGCSCGTGCSCTWGCRAGPGMSAFWLIVLYAMLIKRFPGGGLSVGLSFFFMWIFFREIFKTKCKMKREGIDDAELEEAAEAEVADEE